MERERNCSSSRRGMHSPTAWLFSTGKSGIVGNHRQAPQISIRECKWGAMDFHLQRQSLLGRAARVEEQARRERNAQARDLMHALILLYRELAEEIEERALFERRFDAAVCADLARVIDQ